MAWFVGQIRAWDRHAFAKETRKSIGQHDGHRASVFRSAQQEIDRCGSLGPGLRLHPIGSADGQAEAECEAMIERRPFRNVNK